MKLLKSLALCASLLMSSSSICGQVVKRPEGRAARPMSDVRLVSPSVTCVTWSEDGRMVAAGLWNRRLHIKHLPRGASPTWINLNVLPRTVAFAAPGAIAVIGTATDAGLKESPTVLEIWGVRSELCILRRELATQADAIVEISQDGSRLAIVRDLDSIEVVETWSGAIVGTWRAELSVASVGLNADGSNLVVGYKDGSIDLVEVSGMKRLWRNRLVLSGIDDVQFDPSSTLVVVNATSRERTITAVSVESGSKVAEFRTDGTVVSVAVSARGEVVGWVDSEAFLQIGDVRTGGVARVIETQLERMFVVSVDSQGHRIAVGSGFASEMGELRVWTTASRKLEYSAFGIKLGAIRRKVPQ